LVDSRKKRRKYFTLAAADKRCRKGRKTGRKDEHHNATVYILFVTIQDILEKEKKVASTTSQFEKGSWYYISSCHDVLAKQARTISWL